MYSRLLYCVKNLTVTMGHNFLKVISYDKHMKTMLLAAEKVEKNYICSVMLVAHNGRIIIGYPPLFVESARGEDISDRQIAWCCII